MINLLRALGSMQSNTSVKRWTRKKKVPEQDVRACARLLEYFIAIGNLGGINLNTGMVRGVMKKYADKTEVVK